MSYLPPDCFEHSSAAFCGPPPGSLKMKKLSVFPLELDPSSPHATAHRQGEESGDQDPRSTHGRTLPPNLDP
jgi:hypothetical protein